MTSSPTSSPDSIRELTHGELIEFLRVLEAAKRSVEVTVSTQYGSGRLWTRSGNVVDGEFSGLTGRPAVLRLLNLSHGQFTYRSDTSHPIAFSESVSELIAAQVKRADSWSSLVASGPSLDAALKLRGDRLDSVSPPPSSRQRQFLRLLDGERTLAAAIEQSGFDAVEALTTVQRHMALGTVESVNAGGPDALSQLPQGKPGERSGLLPAEARREATRAVPGPAPEAAALTRRGFELLPQTPRRAADSEPVMKAGDDPVVVARTLAVYGSAHSPLNDSQHRTRTLMGLSEPPPKVTSSDGERLQPIRQKVVEAGKNAPLAHSGASGAAIRPTPTTSVLGARGGAPAPAPAPAPASDQPEPVHSSRGGAVRLGRYEVLCCINRGGMGSVYLCRLRGDAGFLRSFAVKVIRRHLDTTEEARELFFHEARLAGHLHHPNVVNIVDLGIHEGQPYLVMDYVEGCSFDELLKRDANPRPVALVVKIVLDLLSGLQGAHTVTDDRGAPMQLVHCDVSPHNVLIGLDGNCRLTDFGVARSRDRASLPQQTHGKPSYLAPEQITGDPVDCRADVFAAGIVLYNALTGTTLFQAGSIEQTLRNVLHQKILPPSQIAPVPAPEFDFVCMRALERDPSKRFQSAEEMMMELRRVAIQNDALATSREVGAWVQSFFGQELQLRRLASLDSFLGSGVAFDAPDADEGPEANSPTGRGSSPPEAASPAARSSGGLMGSDRNAAILAGIVLAVALVLAWLL